jgi:hypothetical protein
MTNELKAKLLADGRKEYDTLQATCSQTVQRTDEDLLANPNETDEMFGVANDPENRRAEARKLQDQLDQQGREVFAEKYAKTKYPNFAQTDRVAGE